MCVVEWTGATFSLCTVWKNENWPFFVTNNTVCCYIRMKYEWRARSCYTSLIFLLNKGCWLISRGWNLCRLVCLWGGGKGTTTNLIWPPHFNFTPSLHQPPRFHSPPVQTFQKLLLFLSHHLKHLPLSSPLLALSALPALLSPLPPSTNVDYSPPKAPPVAFWCKNAPDQITKSWAATEMSQMLDLLCYA